MPAKKQYADAFAYENKLHRVMGRFGASEYNYDWSRHAAFVEFRLHGQLYRFDHSTDKAALRGFKLSYGTDVFAQIVLTLEDLARMSERGLYEIDTWLVGMKFLPPPEVIPECIKALGFDAIPGRAEDVEARYKTLAKTVHPDGGGSEDAFVQLQGDAKAAIEYVRNREGRP